MDLDNKKLSLGQRPPKSLGTKVGITGLVAIGLFYFFARQLPESAEDTQMQRHVQGYEQRIQNPTSYPDYRLAN